jgi:hypothetical protein
MTTLEKKIEALLIHDAEEEKFRSLNLSELDSLMHPSYTLIIVKREDAFGILLTQEERAEILHDILNPKPSPYAGCSVDSTMDHSLDGRTAENYPNDYFC